HGWGDLESTGAGIPAATADLSVVVPFNDVSALRAVVEARAEVIAAVLVEPCLAHVGVGPPDDGYLAQVAELAREHGILLIFDEVTTGFRLAAGGAQEHYAVMPDLCAIGGAVGGGLPFASVGGRADIMQLATDKRVRFGGTHGGAALPLSGAD